MRIVFVRHGHPDYAHDCLTALGRTQAAAAALRLKDEGIEQIYSSTRGRAMETARYTADQLGLEVIPCDFMREIDWGGQNGEDIPFDGHPWEAAFDMARHGASLLSPTWAEEEPFCRNKVVEHVQHIAQATDAWLLGLGYRREGLYYRRAGDGPQTVAAFGHGGALAAMLGHMFNLPFPFMCAAMGPDFTGITVVTLPDSGEMASPHLDLLGDARHIRSGGVSFDK